MDEELSRMTLSFVENTKIMTNLSDFKCNPSNLHTP